MANPVELYSVELLGPHTHAGQACGAGDRIDVNAAEREFLINIKKINELGDKAEAKAKKATAAATVMTTAEESK